MYEYFKGIISKITAKYIVLEVNSIGYILHVANPYAYSGHLHQEAKVYVHQVVREDAELLYGFATEEEKQLFLSLISVSGIGPVSALAIIAADDNAGLVQAIEQKNITYLTKFPKIGKEDSPADGAGLGRKGSGGGMVWQKVRHPSRLWIIRSWRKPWKPCWLWATKLLSSRKSRNSLKAQRIQLKTISSQLSRCWWNRRKLWPNAAAG